MDPVIDGPRVLWCSSSRGQARHERIEPLAAKSITYKGCRIGHVAEPQGSALEQSGAVVCRQFAARAGSRPNETRHLMTALHQRAHVSSADGAGGPQHEHAPWVKRSLNNLPCGVDGVRHDGFSVVLLVDRVRTQENVSGRGPLIL